MTVYYAGASDGNILVEGCQDSLFIAGDVKRRIKNFSPSCTVSEHSKKYKETSNLVI
jgi:hypothetical protein